MKSRVFNNSWLLSVGNTSLTLLRDVSQRGWITESAVVGHHKPNDMKKPQRLLQRTKTSGSISPTKEQVHFRLGPGQTRAEHILTSRSMYKMWWLKQLCMHLQAPARALSTNLGLQVQKELFTRGTDVPEIDEETFSPKSNRRLLILICWLPTPP